MTAASSGSGCCGVVEKAGSTTHTDTEAQGPACVSAVSARNGKIILAPRSLALATLVDLDVRAAREDATPLTGRGAHWLPATLGR